MQKVVRDFVKQEVAPFVPEMEKGRFPTSLLKKMAERGWMGLPIPAKYNGAGHDPMGPLALADLIGLDTCLYIMETLHEGFGDDKYRPCPLLKQYVSAGRLGKKTGRGFYTYEKQPT
ncbi:hypothetical protein DT075_00090 [Bacillus licheniformis]|nr:hypothetical protein DT075_00090 [Bacillus licheniformis]